jgi:hypothetical protein
MASSAAHKVPAVAEFRAQAFWRLLAPLPDSPKRSYLKAAFIVLKIYVSGGP